MTQLRQIAFDEGNARFNHRVAGIAFSEGRVLLHRGEYDDFWSMPGGRVHLLEPSNEALVREMREELLTEVRVERLLWVVENFFSHENRDYHELGFYYLMSLQPDSAPCHAREPFEGIDDTAKIIFQWFDLDLLGTLPIYPTFLREGLRNLPEHVRHLVHRDPTAASQSEERGEK
jgi:ADP-ribose pyrophosphatase YjhB (NUDIX family)